MGVDQNASHILRAIYKNSSAIDKHNFKQKVMSASKHLQIFSSLDPLLDLSIQTIMEKLSVNIFKFLFSKNRHVNLRRIKIFH